MIEKVKDYDVISFDIFDTLIFRPMSLPTDAFYLIAERFDMLDFKNVRTFAEWDARMQCSRKNGHMEIDLQQIWEHLAKETGLDVDEGMRVEYVYWSRKAATKLMADEDRHDFFRRFIYHKINQKITIKEVLHSMELDILIEALPDWKQIWEEKEHARQRDSEKLAYKQLEKARLNAQQKMQMKQKLERQFSEENLKRERNRSFVALRPQDYLTDKNAYQLNRFIQAKWDLVIEQYAQQQTAAKKYYARVLHDCKKVAAVDIGWAGSGAMALSHLAEKVWGLDCQITGIIAGTNTIHNAEPDAAEPFLQDGRLVSYLYSAQMNRDLLKKHEVKGFAS